MDMYEKNKAYVKNKSSGFKKSMTHSFLIIFNN